MATWKAQGRGQAFPFPPVQLNVYRVKDGWMDGQTTEQTVKISF